MDECWRVLRDDGSAWINLGDKFAGSGGHNNAGLDSGSGIDRGYKECVECGRRVDEKRCHVCGGRMRWVRPERAVTRRQSPDRYNQNTGGLRPKSRMLLPHRFALGLIDPEYRAFEEHRAGLTPMVDAPQWICRMDVVWSKLNGLPESVTDRVRASHEYWLHFTKSERYFAAMDEVREDYAPGTAERYAAGYKPDARAASGLQNQGPTRSKAAGEWGAGEVGTNPLGKLPGSVWSVATEPLQIPDDLPQHFAAFPSEFPRRVVSGWSPSGVCVACGEPRRPVSERTLDVNHVQRRTRGRMDSGDDGSGRTAESSFGITDRSVVGSYRTTITGYACACPTPDAPTRLAVCLDPFSGTGTAPIVAAALGRHGVGVDLSWDYHRIARWRDRDGGLRAKALGVDRPERQVVGQESLFDA